jgi:hypothetical protein
MFELPKVGELLEVTNIDHPYELLILACDQEQGVWTVLCSDDNELALVVFDENRNYRFLPKRRFKESWEQ